MPQRRRRNFKDYLLSRRKLTIVNPKLMRLKRNEQEKMLIS